MRQLKQYWVCGIMILVGLGGCVPEDSWEVTGSFSIDLPTVEGLAVTERTFPRVSFESHGTMFTFTAVNRGMSESTIQVSVDPGLEGKYYAALVLTLGAFKDISGTATDREVSSLYFVGSVTETSIRFETSPPQNPVHIDLTIKNNNPQLSIGCQIAILRRRSNGPSWR